MEKNKDKSHLIDQLYDYLEEQIQELKTDRNQLNHKMQDMIQEKNEKEGAINNQQKIYQIRKVFSPLPLEIEEEKQPVSEDMIQIEKEIHEFQMILREKEEKITKLHDYQKGLEETCLFAEEFVEREDQKILFVPAFEQLMGYVKKLYPTQRINYQDSSESSKVCMTFSFLKGFQAVLESLLNEIGVFVLNFEMNIDEYKILINIEAKPKVIKNAKESFDKVNNDNKKINIIVTKEKNVDKIKINIIDNGIGMTKEQLENIFEPFVGYNENAPGLGLSIVSRIIKDHHGVIKISSELDEGTDVKITLNIYKEEIL